MDSILSTASGKKKNVAPPTVTKPESPKLKDESFQKTKVSHKALSPVKKSDNLISCAVKIITDEIGVDTAELLDESIFAELGVDSLLSLTITGKMREMLEIEVASTLFDECPTLRELKHYLKLKNEGDSVSEETSDELASGNSSIAASSPGMTTPGLDTESASSGPEDDDITVRGDNKTVNLIRSTIAAEMDMDPEEINSLTDLAELGMDSLMSLTVLSKLRETINEEISSDFFAENTTFKAIEDHYGIQQVLPRPLFFQIQ